MGVTRGWLFIATMNEEMFKCGLCWKRLKINQKITNQKTIAKAQRVYGAINCDLCIKCSKSLRTMCSRKNEGMIIKNAINSFAKAKEGLINTDTFLKLESLDAITDAIGVRIANLFKELERNTELLNAATRVQSEFSRTLGNALWDTYGARRYRANRALSRTELRIIVFAKDNWQCKICGTGAKLTVDHIIPVAKGGGNDIENLQTLCLSCNSRKGDSLPENILVI